MCMNQSRSTGCKHGGAFGVFECFGGSESARLAGPRMQMCGGGVLSAPVSGHVHVTRRAAPHCAHQTVNTCGTNRTVQPIFDGVCKSAFCNAFVQFRGGGKHLESQIPSTPCICDRESRITVGSECVHAPAEGGGTLCAPSWGVGGGAEGKLQAGLPLEIHSQCSRQMHQPGARWPAVPGQPGRKIIPGSVAE